MGWEGIKVFNCWFKVDNVFKCHLFCKCRCHSRNDQCKYQFLGRASKLRFRHLFLKLPLQLVAVSCIFFFKQLKRKPKGLSPLCIFFFLQAINYVNYFSEVVFVLLGVCWQRRQLLWWTLYIASSALFWSSAASWSLSHGALTQGSKWLFIPTLVWCSSRTIPSSTTPTSYSKVRNCINSR